MGSQSVMTLLNSYQVAGPKGRGGEGRREGRERRRVGEGRGRGREKRGGEGRREEKGNSGWFWIS